MSTFESFGKYVLLEKLATGGMAEVFLARGTGAGGIGKFFAIKRILPQYADSPEFIEMFKDEAKIAINLNHSNIVSIHEFGVEKGQFFLVMDYVEGRNLRQILNKMKKSALQFSIDQIVYCIKEVAGGLDHAHRCIDGSTGKPLNITHRDMSPQNLMVSFEGEVKIVDFGIAKAESQLETTRAGTLKGKFGYMSPEQAEGQPVDLRTDIFSLGIVMWELLANDRLFVANNEINTLRKIRDCQIPSLRKINPNIHTELERIVHKALARDRNLRYQTGAALHRDLNRFLNRQYPDFSPQDFAVFIKSVFADEILQLRKRLVDYSKVNLANSGKGAEKNFGEQTSLLEQNTSSLVISESGARPLEKSKVAPARTVEVNTASQPPESSLLTSTTPVDRSIEIAPDLEEDLEDSDIHDLPPPVAGRANSKFLNVEALEAESKRDVNVSPKAPMQLDPEEGSSPGLNTREREYQPPSTANAGTRTSHRPLPPQPQKPVRIATFAVFAILCLSVYAYLVKYFTPTMTPVINMTDVSVIHEFYVALDVVGQKDKGSNSEPENRPVPQSPPPQPPPTVTPPPPAPEVPESLVVTTVPSGAEILIDEKSTGLFTPVQVKVPKGKFSITIRKRGYVDYKQREVTMESFGRYMNVNLVKRNVAYLDIDVIPPQGAHVYINGRLLDPQKGPLHEIPVPANTELKVRAENKNATAYDEIRVNLPVDRRQTIQLNPHTPLRVPSNSPNE